MPARLRPIERLESSATVLGLAVAGWLYELFPDEPEGQLSKRLNALVARDVCAEVARELGIPDRVRLGKQARDDGASDSDNVIGDVVESLIGALYLDSGLEAAIASSRALGGPGQCRRQGRRASQIGPQEWAAAQERKRRPSPRDRSGLVTPDLVVESRSVAWARPRRGLLKQRRRCGARLLEQLSDCEMRLFRSRRAQSGKSTLVMPCVPEGARVSSRRRRPDPAMASPSRRGAVCWSHARYLRAKRRSNGRWWLRLVRIGRFPTHRLVFDSKTGDSRDIGDDGGAGDRR